LNQRIPLKEMMMFKVRALYPFHGNPASNGRELSFEIGAVILVGDMTKVNGGWISGCLEVDPSRKFGWFPISYVHQTQDYHYPPVQPKWPQPQLQQMSSAQFQVTSSSPYHQYPSHTTMVVIPETTGTEQFSPKNGANEEEDNNDVDFFSGGAMGGEWTGSNAMTEKYKIDNPSCTVIATPISPTSTATASSSQRRAGSKVFGSRLKGNNNKNSMAYNSSYWNPSDRDRKTTSKVSKGVLPSVNKILFRNKNKQQQEKQQQKQAVSGGGDGVEDIFVIATPISSLDPTTVSPQRHATGPTDISNRSKNENNSSNNSLNPLGRFRKATSKISQNEIFCKNGNKHQQQHQQSRQPPVADGSVTTTSLIGHKKGFFPGQKIQTVTTQEKSDRGCGGMFGGNKTTVTTTSRPSGGFNPILGGKTTTSTTTHRGVFGNATSVETHTQQSGGFTIIPLGVIGLAAVGAIAAKNAYDSKTTRLLRMCFH